MEDEFYRLAEISELLKVAPATPYKWIREGHLPAYRLGRSLRVAKEDLDEFIRARRYDAKENEEASSTATKRWHKAEVREKASTIRDRTPEV